MLTGQRYSSIWGSAAIVASMVYTFPTIRPVLAAFGGYAAIWVGFNLVRAIADDAGLAIAGTEAVSRWERSLFGGSLPSAQLQTSFFDSGKVQAQDVILSLIHGSFFIVPFVVVALVWWRARALFRPCAVATALTFGVVYLGEHFVLDAVLGWITAIIAWWITCRWFTAEKSDQAVVNLEHPLRGRWDQSVREVTP